MKKSVFLPIALILMAIAPLLAVAPFFEAAAGIIGRVAVSRGFTLADPRVRETIGNVVYLVGSQAAAGKAIGSKTSLLKQIGVFSAVAGIAAIPGLLIDENGNAKMSGNAPSTASISQGDQLFTKDGVSTNLANAYSIMSKTNTNTNCPTNYPNCRIVAEPELTIQRDSYNTIQALHLIYNIYNNENDQLVTNFANTWYPGDVSAQNYPCAAINQSGCIDEETPYLNPSDFFDSLTPAQKEIPVDPAFFADFLNEKWNDVSIELGFDGIPWSVNNPITPADVEQFYSQNQPLTLGAIAQPMDVVAGPSGNPLVNMNVDTSVGQNPETNPNSDKEGPNLGPNPNIGSPVVPNISENEILAPILNLLPSFKNFQIVEPFVSCSPIEIDVWFVSTSTDAHCEMFEIASPILQIFMTIFWIFAGIRIVLEA